MAQAPRRFEMFTEGTKGWAVVGMWMLFKEPTEKWRSLAHALKFSALRRNEIGSVGGVSLPAEKGSDKRLLMAARAGAKAVMNAYFGYYMGVYDIGVALGDEAEELGRPRSAMLLREAAYLWAVRARAFRGTNINLMAKDDKSDNVNHMRIPGPRCDLNIVPVPYRGFAGYQAHVKDSKILPKEYKRHIAKKLKGPVSNVFREWGREVYMVKETLLTRYLRSAARLADDMENAWRELSGDIKAVVAIYGKEEDRTLPPPGEPDRKSKIRRTDWSGGIDFSQYEVKKRNDFNAMVGSMDPDNFEWLEDTLKKLGPDREEYYRSREYEDLDELLTLVCEEEDNLGTVSVPNTETIR